MSKIKNIEITGKKIKQAVKNNERIILYGDSDLDGISSVVILKEAIENMGGKVAVTAFPDREKDGYGLNFKALDFLKDFAPALLITLDLGIGNVQEIKKANQMHFEIIVVDHHKVLGELPPASIIIDPHQEGDESENQYLCTAGIAFKLAEELHSDNLAKEFRNSLLELTALATLADMMPQEKDNKVFIKEGLQSLKNTSRPGLKTFLEILKDKAQENNFSRITSALGAAESHDFKNQAYELLTETNFEKCKDLAQNLIDKNALKQQKIKEIVEEVKKRIERDPSTSPGSAPLIIFEGDKAWRLVLAGPVASIIAAEYKLPTFIFKKGEEISCGSVRSLKEEQNSVEAMSSCADLLITYGGHPKASGFRIKTGNLEKFKDCLVKYFSK